MSRSFPLGKPSFPLSLGGLCRRRFVGGNFDSVRMLQYSLAAINSPNDTVGCSVKLLCALLAAASASLFWRLIQAQLRLTERLPPCFWNARLPPGGQGAARPPRGCAAWPPLCVPTSARASRARPWPGTSLQRGSLGEHGASTASRQRPRVSFQLPSSLLLPDDSTVAQQKQRLLKQFPA